jgi:response regulator RpfG family c-di-GMP phosphodiesterase
MDFMMPDMDGYEVTGMITANPVTAAIPVVMCTGHDTPQDRARQGQRRKRLRDQTGRRYRARYLLAQLHERAPSARPAAEAAAEVVEERTMATIVSAPPVVAAAGHECPVRRERDSDPSVSPAR